MGVFGPATLQWQRIPSFAESKPMQRFAFLIAFLPCLTTGQAADELAVVTAEAGYLLNEAGDVIDTVSLFETLDVTGDNGDCVAVRRGDQELRIHRGCVHRMSRFGDLTENELKGLRSVFNLLRKSNQLSQDEQHLKAAQAAEQAVSVAIGELGLSTWEMWTRQFHAYVLLQRGDGNTRDVALVMEKCLASMNALDAEDHLHAADVFSTLGMLREAEGDTAAAIAAHQQSSLIALSHLGLEHHDTAVIRVNEALSQQAAGNFAQAAQLQKLALVTFDRILPPSAKMFPDSWQRLGQFRRDDGDHEAAIEMFTKAAEHYSEHHPDLLVELANVNTDLIYSHTQLKNFALAEAVCGANLQLTLRMDGDDDRRYYKRDTKIRQGTIDFDRKDFQAALDHYKAATDLTDSENFEYDDGVALEAVGDTHLALGSIPNAVAAYEDAIGVFAVTVGSESDEVLNLRDHVYTHADIPYKASDAHCVAALPKAFLTDADGNTLATIPGLTVLPVIGTEDDSVTVEFRGQTGFVAASHLHLQRNIPGYGIGKRQDLGKVMESVAGALDGLQKQDVKIAEGSAARAIGLCEAAYPEDCTLLLWLKVFEAGIHMRTRGEEAAQQKLDAISAEVDALNPDSYPLFVEFTQAKAAILSEQQKPKEASALLTPILGPTKELYGDNHAVVRLLERHIGINLFHAGQHDEAVKHLQTAVRIARQIYPDDSELVAETVSDFAILLTQIERYESSAKAIEQYLAVVSNPPKSHHAMLVATLGKAYSRMGRKKEARDLLSTTIIVQQGKDNNAVIENPSGLLAYSELGSIELAENNWQAAADSFQNAVKAAIAMGLGDNFSVAELRRQRAQALQMLDNTADAATELREVVRIYEVLGGGDSPQAEAILEQLAAMDSALAAKDMDSSLAEKPAGDVVSELAALMNLMPDGERMFRTTAEKPIAAAPEADADIIGTLKPDTDIWSLEDRDGFHRIYSSDNKRFGWVAASDLQLRSDYAFGEGKKKLKKKLWFFQLAACEKAFEEGMNISDDDPQVEIEVLKKSIATIDSKYKLGNELKGLLSERLVAAYQRAGDSSSIAVLADEHLGSALDAGGYDHPYTALLSRVSAENDLNIGDESWSGQESILKICEKSFGPDDPRTLMQRLGYAAALVRLGEFSKAETIYRSVSKVGGDNAGSVFLRSSAEMGLGLLRASERHHVAAARHLETALEGFDSLEHPAPSLTVQSAIALAVSVYESGEAEEAIQILDRVGELPLLPSDAQVRLSYLSQKARLLVAVDPKRALKVAEEALVFSREAFGKGSLLPVNAWAAQAAAQATSGDTENAANSFQNARQLAYVYSHFMVSFQRLNRRLSFAAEDARRLEDALRMATDSPSQNVVDKSAEWLFNGHALETELHGRKHQITATLDLDSDTALFLWEYSQQKLCDVPLRNLTNSEKPFTDMFAELKQTAIDDRAKLPEATRKLISSPPNWINLQAVRKSLAGNEVLVLFRRMKNPAGYANRVSSQLPRDAQDAAYFAWVIPAEGRGDVQVINVGDARQIDSLAYQLHTHLSEYARRTSAKSSLPVATNMEIGLRRQLAEKVWQRIAHGFPEGCDSVTIVEDGKLRGLPWAALTLPGGDSVCDRFATRVVGNPRDLLRPGHELELSRPAMFVRPDRQNRSLDAVPFTRAERQGVGRRSGSSRLHFDKLDLQRAIPNRRTIVNSTFQRFADNSFGIPRGDDSANGLTAVQKAWNALFDQSPKIYDDGECSQLGFFKQTRPAALHIEAATFARQSQPVERSAKFASIESRKLIADGKQGDVSPLLNCGLLVAGVAATGETSFIINDGVFTGEEIIGLDLRGTKLVTLSVAPRDADGSASSPEANAALVSAFQLAGARAVVSGLWPLDEHHADAMLQRFYLQLGEGRSFDEAIRNAQQTFRKQHGRRTSSAFWASFQVYGQNGQIR